MCIAGCGIAERTDVCVMSWWNDVECYDSVKGMFRFGKWNVVIQ